MVRTLSFPLCYPQLAGQQTMFGEIIEFTNRKIGKGQRTLLDSCLRLLRTNGRITQPDVEKVRRSQPKAADSVDYVVELLKQALAGVIRSDLSVNLVTLNDHPTCRQRLSMADPALKILLGGGHFSPYSHEAFTSDLPIEPESWLPWANYQLKYFTAQAVVVAGPKADQNLSSVEGTVVSESLARALVWVQVLTSAETNEPAEAYRRLAQFGPSWRPPIQIVVPVWTDLRREVFSVLEVVGDKIVYGQPFRLFDHEVRKFNRFI